MRIRLLAAATTAALLAGLSAASAHADVLKTRDGRWFPKGVPLDANGVPGPQLMEDHRTKKIEPLSYDSVKIGGVDVPPGAVAEVYVYDAEQNQAFQEGERNAEGGLFQEAAASFATAAEELRGNGRMLALYKQALTLAFAGDADAMVAAIDVLVAEFPKTYFLADVQMRKARVMKAQGKVQEAVAACDKVAGAPGMNRRAVHDAELLKIFLTQYVEAGRDTDRWAKAEAAYRDRLAQIERETARADVEDVRMRALVGVGRCLVYQSKFADARAQLQQVADAPLGAADVEVRAAAYAGLGDVVINDASEVQAKLAADKSLKDRYAALLDEALRHYLRVTELYGRDAAPGDLLWSRWQVARILVRVFTLSGDTDCESAGRALTYFSQARDMADGPERNSINREGGEFKKRRDAACEKKDKPK